MATKVWFKHRAWIPVAWLLSIANVGAVPDPALAQELHPGEPGYFVLGAKAAGRGGDFLLRRGFEQVREVFAQLLGRPGLDLYRP